MLKDTPEESQPNVDEAQPATKQVKHNRLLDFLKTKKGKIVAGVVIGLMVVAVLFAVPATRYAILGTFIKKQVTVFVSEPTSADLPVTDVQIAFAGQSATTGSDGRVTFTNVPVGPWQMNAVKEYYTDASQSVKVKVFGQTNVSLTMEATGRRVPVTVINKVSGLPIKDATVTSGQATAVTNQDGQALIVVPVGATAPVTITATDYNSLAGELVVTDQKDDKNTFEVVPTGKLYFLSKRTGQINVMKSDLDGGNAQVVVQATGKERDDATVLLASRDWKYLVLKALRDGDRPKLYLIDTATDKMTLIDEGKVIFTLAGWANGHFIYSVAREEVKAWEPKSQALKSYNPATGKITIVDETLGMGTNQYDFQHEFLENMYIFGDKVTYTKRWNYGSLVTIDKKSSINEVSNDGGSKKVLKEFEKNVYFEAKLYNPKEEYFRVEGGGATKPSFYEYEDGKVKDVADITDDTFRKFYPTFLVSPSAKLTLWHEPRDGKNSLFVGNNEGADAKEIASKSEFASYGWYTDDYLLFSKNGSELYITPKDNPNNITPLKITDYHKATNGYYGYGYGYGGL